MPELDGRIAVVTGAAHGIGLEIARRLAAEGARLVLGDLNADGLENARKELEASGAEVLTEAGDLRTETAAHALIDRATRDLGGLDVLVNNAGIWVIKSLEETSPEEWDSQLDTNLRAVYLLARRAIPALRASPHGAVVNIASMAAIRFTVPHVAYAASKAGVVAFTRDLAVELAPDRVRVNAVAPGPIDTRGLSDGMADEVGQRFLLGRMGTPRDIAEAVLFLASDRASYITGATLPVTGGAELRTPPLL